MNYSVTSMINFCVVTELIILFLMFQLRKTVDWKPAIHLDNRYRLMRHEPMLDADGNVTDQIGEDENAGSLEDLLQ